VGVSASNEADAFYAHIYQYFYHKGLYAIVIKEVR
jgi:hypothetical protein